jgi:hypothetical protein
MATTKDFWKLFHNAIEVVKMKSINEFDVYCPISGNASIKLDIAFPDQALFQWMSKLRGPFKSFKYTLEPNPYSILVDFKRTSWSLM